LIELAIFFFSKNKLKRLVQAFCMFVMHFYLFLKGCEAIWSKIKMNEKGDKIFEKKSLKI
jgi:hypothetical protein